MTESAQNLEIAKRGPATPPNTPKKSPTNNIKERLNLHVKRRLQQEAPKVVETQQHSAINSPVNNNNTGQCSVDNKSIEFAQNEAPDKPMKGRKSYQKRTEKSAHDGTAVRKYKRKKQQVFGSTVGNKVDDGSCSTVVGNLEALSNCGTFGGNTDDGDGSRDGQDAEIKSSREKDKCTDVLGMVLNAKKNALMQHPDVQAFLKQVMEVIKS